MQIMSRIPQSFFANTRLDLLVNEAIKIVENKVCQLTINYQKLIVYLFICYFVYSNI